MQLYTILRGSLLLMEEIEESNANDLDYRVRRDRRYCVTCIAIFLLVPSALSAFWSRDFSDHAFVRMVWVSEEQVDYLNRARVGLLII